MRTSSAQSYEEATAPLEETPQHEDEEEFSLHFQLGELKLGLAEIRDKMEDLRTGQSRSRGSGEPNRHTWSKPASPSAFLTSLTLSGSRGGGGASPSCTQVEAG